MENRALENAAFVAAHAGHCIGEWLVPGIDPETGNMWTFSVDDGLSVPKNVHIFGTSENESTDPLRSTSVMGSGASVTVRFHGEPNLGFVTWKTLAAFVRAGIDVSPEMVVKVATKAVPTVGQRSFLFWYNSGRWSIIEGTVVHLLGAGLSLKGDDGQFYCPSGRTPFWRWGRKFVVVNKIQQMCWVLDF